MKEITLETIFNVILDFKEETKSKFNSLEKRIDKLEFAYDENFSTFGKKLTSLENIVTKIEHEHGERLTTLEKIVTKIEYDHGEKLAALCDNVKVNNEKHEEFSQRLDKIESKISDYDVQIEFLEEKLS